MTSAIPLITAIVSLVFAFTVLDQFFARRKPYQLVWAVGLLMYSIAAGAEFRMESQLASQGVMESELAYRLWYLIGAIFVAAFLGMGTLYLLLRRRPVNIIMGFLLAVSAYAIYAVFAADIDLTGMTAITGEAMPTTLRALTPVFNVFGTLALVGGAVYSAWIFWRKRILPHRVVSNVLIAVGAILPAAGGASLKTGGSTEAFYIL
ncbi:MAG: hypothetical protein V3S10_05670, partial [Dehalococcoidales bacterium]